MASKPPQQIDPAAAIAAVVFPGAGHVLRRRTSRGVLAAVGVLGLFVFGLFIGGIDAVDSKEDKVWFIGQSFVGPLTFAVDYVHQNKFKAYDQSIKKTRTGYPDEHRVERNGQWVWETLTAQEIESGMGPPNTKGLGRLNEIAMLSIVLAGMLNLIVFLDALMPPHQKSAPKRASGSESAPDPSGGAP